jgi:hypothetical protein
MFNRVLLIASSYSREGGVDGRLSTARTRRELELLPPIAAMSCQWGWQTFLVHLFAAWPLATVSHLMIIISFFSVDSSFHFLTWYIYFLSHFFPSYVSDSSLSSFIIHCSWSDPILIIAENYKNFCRVPVLWFYHTFLFIKSWTPFLQIRVFKHSWTICFSHL